MTSKRTSVIDNLAAIGNEILEHQQKLQNAILKQEFEKCATIKNQITQLENVAKDIRKQFELEEQSRQRMYSPSKSSEVIWDELLYSSLIKKYESEMSSAIHNQAFERCATIRDKTNSLEQIKQKFNQTNDNSMKSSLLKQMQLLAVK